MMRKVLRIVLMGLYASALIGLALPGLAVGAENTRFQGVVLRVATWGGATRDGLREYVASEVERRGGKVEFVIGSPQGNFAKLIAARGRVPFDLIEFIGTMVPEIVGRNLLAKLDLKNIPNTKFLKRDQYNSLMVATWVTEEMIIYNKEKFAENHLAPPESLTDLRNPKLAGRVMIPDISSGGGILAVGAFALTAGGNEENIEPGLKLMHEISGLQFWKSGGQVLTQLKSGDIWVAIAHAGWAVRAARGGVPVATNPARIGDKRGLLKEGYIGVVKGSPNLEAAEFFINTYLSTKAQYDFALKVGVVPVNPEARTKLKSVPAIKDLVILDQDKINNMIKLKADKINMGKWIDQWNRMVTTH